MASKVASKIVFTEKTNFAPITIKMSELWPKLPIASYCISWRLASVQLGIGVGRQISGGGQQMRPNSTPCMLI